MRIRTLNVREIVAALALVAVGAFMIWEASGYPYGSLSRMGPGFFPVWIGIVLIVFGVSLVLEVRHLATPPPVLAIRPFTMVPLGLIAFALMIENAGLVPATAVLVLLSGLGSRPVRPRALFWTTAVITLLAYVVLIRAIGVPLRAFWW